MLHFPVLLEESIGFLVDNKSGSFLDCTFGRGGHSNSILNNISENGKLTAFDKDPDAVQYANDSINDSRFKIIHKSFNEIDSIFQEKSLDGILFDLGTCSTHFDDKSRGFSFRDDGPLDMRFNFNTGDPLSEWINKASEKELIDVLYKYGQEKNARSIAKAICAFRQESEIKTTSQLVSIIVSVSSKKFSKIHPATKSFQAFRIFINNELEELEEALEKSKQLIKIGGKIVVISFHSLEDSIVKNSFKTKIKAFPREIPINPIVTKEFDCIARKIRPSNIEIDRNKRSRSAIMRVFKKLP
jgi:16S rRNA (cytosine1402-N4)-methyltransferase